ncbi:MAG TPA: hypothetical protein VFF27_07895, partial [Bacteroidia bacterium]|nr:hypothetical protein [Bacteroidia bacterium]
YKPLSIGNWDYGSVYIDRRELISEQLIHVFHQVNTEIGLFNYARYDIKCNSFDDLSVGEMKILEINGVKGEPIHIYDSRFTLLKAYKEIFKHWEFILQISKRNLKKGVHNNGNFKTLLQHYRIKKESLKYRQHE